MSESSGAGQVGGADESGEPGVSLWDAITRIRRRDARLSPELYAFVMQALDQTIQRIGERRHVEARELLDGFCEFARARFGLLAFDVITKWGVVDVEDIGRAVFQLVDTGVLARQDSDHIEDFHIEYNLQGALEEAYFD